jgi:hypothetical protein
VGKLIGAALALLLAPVLLISAAAAGLVGGENTAQAGQPPASTNALTDIPAAMLVLYQRAATAECDGLPWTVLAAVGKVESDHNRSTLPGAHTSANPLSGAAGPMQFLPFVFHAYAHPVPPPAAPTRPHPTTRSTPSTPPPATCATPAPEAGRTSPARCSSTTTPTPTSPKSSPSPAATLKRTRTLQ